MAAPAGLAAPAQEDASAALGPRIRALRRARELTLTALAARTGLSIGHLSQVERGLSTPTIRQLQGIGSALGVRIASFFEPDPAPPPPGGDAAVLRAGRRRSLRYDGLGMTDFLLSPHLDGRLELLLCRLEPGGASGDEPYSHEGEEAGLVLTGGLDLWLADRHHALDAGDSFHFASTIPHRYRNRVEATTEVLWVITPPTF